MPDTRDLQKFLSGRYVNSGELIEFLDAGEIKKTSFNRDEEEETEVLEMKVLYVPTGKEKLFTINSTNREILTDAWGPLTEKWEGKRAKILKIKQMVFGESKWVIHLEPIGGKSKPDSLAEEED